jgi:CDGSH-type Zn-finger protein
MAEEPMVTITVRPNGNYRVEGRFRIIDVDGNEFPVEGRVVTLCRCGASKNKPFCDSTHRTIGFDAPTKAPTPGGAS